MTILNPPIWREAFYEQGPKYDKIVEMITELNTLLAAPPAHAISHQDAGSDEISVAGLSGELADLQPPKLHAAAHHSGGGDLLAHNSIPGGVSGNPHVGSAPSAHSHLDAEVDNGISLTNITQIGTRPHTSLTSIGTRTHLQLESDLMIGSGNAAYVPCIYEVHSIAGQGALYTGNSLNLRNTGATDAGSAWRLPLPYRRGGLSLYISGVSIDLEDADGDDYVTRVLVASAIYNVRTTLQDVTTNRTAPGRYENTFTPIVANQRYVGVWVEFVLTTLVEMDFVGVELKCHYE